MSYMTWCGQCHESSVHRRIGHWSVTSSRVTLLRKKRRRQRLVTSRLCPRCRTNEYVGVIIYRRIKQCLLYI